jgi:hypothetical protein
MKLGSMEDREMHWPRHRGFGENSESSPASIILTGMTSVNDTRGLGVRLEELVQADLMLGTCQSPNSPRTKGMVRFINFCGKSCGQ